MKYSIITPKASVEFENYQQLVNYLIGTETGRTYWPPRESYLLARVKICEGDKRLAVVGHHYVFIGSWSRNIRVPDYGYVDRDVLILDEFGNNAYNEQLKKDVNTYTYSEDINREHWKYVNRNKKIIYSRWDHLEVEFRKEPVPCTGRRYYGHYWRRPRTSQEKRMSCDPEYAEFYRKRRGNHLPSVWDDLPRSDVEDISWKSCTKNRHQWENKVKINNRNVFVCKSSVESQDEAYNDLE